MEPEFSLARALAVVAIELDASGDFAWFRFSTPERALEAYARLGAAYQPYCTAPNAAVPSVRVPLNSTDVFTAMRDALLSGIPASEIISDPSVSQQWRMNYTAEPVDE